MLTHLVHGEHLLDRDTFRESVFARDAHRCVRCGRNDGQLDAHHIIERRLFTAETERGGYFVSNGATVCRDRAGVPGCHRLAEQTLISPDELRVAAGITTIILPDGTYDGAYTKWLDPILPDGRRGRGPLFHDVSVQRVLREAGVLHLYTQYARYPRTWHLPTSPGRTSDDRIHPNIPFGDREIVVTVKMDGENTTINDDGFVHARSIDGSSHASQDWVRNLGAQIAWQLDPGHRLCGENLYAKHSLRYDALPSYFMLFGVWDGANTCLSWDDVELWAAVLGLHTVPVIYRGRWDLDAITRSFEHYQARHGEQEGWVARDVWAFPYLEFRQHVGKWVRPAHVQDIVHNWRSGWYATPETVNGIGATSAQLSNADAARHESRG